MMYWILLYLAVAVYWISAGYLRSDAVFLVGMALLLPSTLVRRPGFGSWRMGALALLCGVLAWHLNARTFHFLTLAFAALFVYENVRGKVNESPVLIVLLLTAVVKTMSTILGFSIRLYLSDGAARLLAALGMDAHADGNLIVLNGTPFAVDPECMGLQMLEVSFLFGFFLMAVMEKRSGKYLSWPLVLGVVALLGTLNIGYNFLRMLLLVLFRVMPGTVAHDALGLAGLALYVFAPTWLSVRWLYRRFGREKSGDSSENMPLPASFGKKAAMAALSALLLILASRTAWLPADTVNTVTAIVPAGIPEGIRGEVLGDGVVQYAGDSLLVYVKPIRGFYSTEHTPLICWRGSGYSFEKIEQRNTGGAEWFSGILKKGEARLYTAWWYDNGRTRTASQLRWRALDAGGAPGFCLVNVSAATENELQEQVSRMLR